MSGSLAFPPIPFADGTTVQFEVDFDDTLHVISLRCVNGGAENAFGKLAAVAADGTESLTAVYGQSFPPGTTIIAVPDSPANAAIALTANPNKPGKYSGFNFYSQVPG